MIYSSLILPVLGLLFALTEGSGAIRGALVAVLLGALMYDFSRGRAQVPKVPDVSAMAPILLFQLLMSLAWISSLFLKDNLLDLSAVQIALLVGTPWIAIAMTLFRPPPSTQMFGYASSGLGLILFAVSSVILSKLGFHSGETEVLYTSKSATLTSDTFRTVLPGFPGFLAGGAFCALAASSAAASFAISRNLITKGVSAVFYLIAGYGVLLTDSRTSLLIYLLVPALTLGWWLLRFVRQARGYATGNMPLPWARLLIVGVAILPVILPLAAPPIDEAFGNVHIPFVSDHLLRNKETLFSFSGRSDVWRVAWNFISDSDPNVASIRSVGEYAAGVSDDLYALGTIPGRPEWAHSHNAIFNLYFSYGLVGLCVLAVALVYICQSLRRLPFWTQLSFLLPFIAFALEMSFESLLSPAYRYFGIFLTLFMLDLYRDKREHFAGMSNRRQMRRGPRLTQPAEAPVPETQTVAAAEATPKMST